MTLEQQQAIAMANARLRLQQGGAQPTQTPAASAETPSLYNTDIPNPTGIGPSSINPAQAVQTVKNMGLEGGGATLGQTIGAPFAEFGGIQVGGAIGGALGNIAGQLTTPGKDFSLGDVAAASIAGAVPGASLAKASTKTLAQQAGKYAITNVAAQNARSMIDNQGKPASLSEDLLAAAGGAVAAPLAKYFDSGSRVASTTKAFENNAPERAILNAGRQEGLAIGPNQLRTTPKAINTPMEALGNVQATNAATQIKNQVIIDDIARKEAGIPLSGTQKLPNGAQVSSELTPKNLETAKIGPNLVYEQVKSVNNETKGLLSAFKDASNEANLARMQFRQAQEAGKYNRALLDQAEIADASANTLRASLNDALKKAGKGDLIPAFESARVRLAKISAIKNNLLPNGRISSLGLAEDAKNGAMHTDGLGVISNWARTFPKSVADFPREASSQTIFQNPLKMLGFTGMPKAARAVIQSGPYQNNFVTPFYGATTEDLPASLARLGIMQAGRSN